MSKLTLFDWRLLHGVDRTTISSDFTSETQRTCVAFARTEAAIGQLVSATLGSHSPTGQCSREREELSDNFLKRTACGSSMFGTSKMSMLVEAPANIYCDSHYRTLLSWTEKKANNGILHTRCKIGKELRKKCLSEELDWYVMVISGRNEDNLLTAC
jgi:hypothetical protein